MAATGLVHDDVPLSFQRGHQSDQPYSMLYLLQEIAGLLSHEWKRLAQALTMADGCKVLTKKWTFLSQLGWMVQYLNQFEVSFSTHNQ